MRKLNKVQVARAEELEKKLGDRHHDLANAIARFNDEQARLWGEVESAQAAYNDAVTETNEFTEQIASDIQEYIDARSEKWQDGDRAPAYYEWQQQWEVAVEEADLEEPSTIELPDEPVFHENEYPREIGG